MVTIGSNSYPKEEIHRRDHQQHQHCPPRQPIIERITRQQQYDPTLPGRDQVVNQGDPGKCWKQEKRIEKFGHGWDPDQHLSGIEDYCIKVNEVGSALHRLGGFLECQPEANEQKDE